MPCPPLFISIQAAQWQQIKNVIWRWIPRCIHFYKCHNTGLDAKVAFLMDYGNFSQGVPLVLTIGNAIIRLKSGTDGFGNTTLVGLGSWCRCFALRRLRHLSQEQAGDPNQLPPLIISPLILSAQCAHGLTSVISCVWDYRRVYIYFFFLEPGRKESSLGSFEPWDEKGFMLCVHVNHWKLSVSDLIWNDWNIPSE